MSAEDSDVLVRTQWERGSEWMKLQNMGDIPGSPWPHLGNKNQELALMLSEKNSKHESGDSPVKGDNEVWRSADQLVKDKRTLGAVQGKPFWHTVWGLKIQQYNQLCTNLRRKIRSSQCASEHFGQDTRKMGYIHNYIVFSRTNSKSRILYRNESSSSASSTWG